MNNIVRYSFGWDYKQGAPTLILKRGRRVIARVPYYKGIELHKQVTALIKAGDIVQWW